MITVVFPPLAEFDFFGRAGGGLIWKGDITLGSGEFCVWMVGDGTFNELAGLVPDADGVDVLPVSASEPFVESTMKS